MPGRSGLVVFAVEAFAAEEAGRDVVGLAGGAHGGRGLVKFCVENPSLPPAQRLY